MSVLISIFTFVLVLISLFLVLIILMQRAKTDGGMGAALGGGFAESAFGADSGNVLTKATINSAIAFFVVTFLLYLGHIYQRNQRIGDQERLPTVPAELSPVTPTAAPGALWLPAPESPATEAPAAPESAQPVEPEATPAQP